MGTVRKVVLQESIASQYATGYTPVDQQEDLNSISAQYVYNIVWLNEAVPPFVAFDYALAPFGPVPATLTSGKDNSNFTATTTMYSLDLDCESPTVTTDSTGAKEYNSTRGCSISGPPENDSDSAGHWDTSKTFRSMYIGHNPEYWNYGNWYLYETCPDVCWIRLSERTPEAVAASEDKAISTALFCNPSYYQQQVNATISLSSKQVHSATPTGEKLDLPPDIFNTTHFEYALTSGATSYKIRTDYPSNSFPSQDNKLRDLPLNVNLITPMAGFAVSMNKESLDTYMDPQALHKSYESTYRLLFARQMAQILKATPDAATENSGQLSLAMEAVQVVPEFAYIVMATLGLVTLFCCWLLFLMMRRRSLLCGDPGSIGALMDLVATSPNLIGSFFDLGISTADTLRSRFKHRKFVLRGTSSQSLPSLELTVRGHTDIVDRAASVTENSTQQDARPSELRWFAGVGFLAIQALATGTFIGLYIFAQSHDGIPLPTDGTFVRQLVEKYIPLGVAASIEAFWIVLNRLICLLQPWEALHVGNAKAKRSIDLNYNYLPPQLVFVRALKSRHVKLASICLMAILANVLTVALGGLMYEGTANITEAAKFSQLYEPNLRTTSRPDLSENATTTGWGDRDHFYQVMSNITSGTQLPSWVDDDWAYIPLELPQQGNASFHVSTHCFGAILDCALATPEILAWNDSTAAVNLPVTVSVVADAGTTERCQTMTESLHSGLDITGRAALEFISPLENAGNTSVNDGICKQHFVAGWARADLNGSKSVDLSDSTIVVCRPSLFQATADIIVASDARVRSQVVDPTPSPITDNKLIEQANLLIAYGYGYSAGSWHQDDHPSDWFNYLVASANSSLALFNVSAPVPSFENVASGVEQMYRRLFALLVRNSLDSLFEAPAQPADIPGSILAHQTRIFVSFPAFIVSVAILCPYILVITWLYLQRPWNRLPRLPTTIASIIAYFAASNALRQMSLQNEIDGESFDRKNWRWGYGSFVGSDGRRHVGVECEKWLNRQNEEDVEMSDLVVAEDENGRR